MSSVRATVLGFSAASLALGLALVACKGDEGGNDAGGDGAVTADGGSGGNFAGSCTLLDAAVTGVPSCDTCVEAKCCSVQNACANDDACKSYVTCTSRCLKKLVDAGADAGESRDECTRTCGSYDGGGHPLFLEATACISKSCAAECP